LGRGVGEGAEKGPEGVRAVGCVGLVVEVEVGVKGPRMGVDVGGEVLLLLPRGFADIRVCPFAWFSSGGELGEEELECREGREGRGDREGREGAEGED